MKLTINEELGARQLRRQIELTPEIFAGTGKHCLRARLVSVQTFSQSTNSLQVRPCVPVLSLLLRFAEHIANQIFHEDRFFAMRLVLRSGRFKIKAQCASVVTIG